MQKFTKILLATVLAITNSILIFPEATHAGANDFYFKKFNANYHLSKQADNTSKMTVEETLVAVFPNYNQNRGIERIIPFLNQNGTNLTMDSTTELDISVTRNGKSEPYTIRAYNDHFLVRIGNPEVYVHGENTYVLKYNFTHVITEFDNSLYSLEPYQELYWDANGTGWRQRFDEVNVNLTMDDAIYQNLLKNREIKKTTSYKTKNFIHENNETANKYAAWCYVGRLGANNQSRCKITDIKNGINFNTKNLAGGENLTFVTNFKKDTLKVPKNDYIKEENYSDIKLDYYLSKTEDGHLKAKVVENFKGAFPTQNITKTFARRISFLNKNRTRYVASLNDINPELEMDGQKIEAKASENFSSGQITVSNSDEKEYLHGEHNFKLTYELHDIVEDTNNGQEIFLIPLQQFTGEIKSETITFHLSDELAGALQGEQICDTKNNCAYKKDGNNLIFESASEKNRNDLKISLSFKPNTFKIPEPNKNYIAYHVAIVTIIAIIIAFYIFHKKTYQKIGNKIKYLKNRPVVPEYQPYKGLSVGQAAKIYMKPTKNPRAATMLELVVEKKLALICDKKRKFGESEWSGKVLSLKGLTEDQKDLLKILNRGKDVEAVGTSFKLKKHGYSKALENAFSDYDKDIEKILKAGKYIETEKDDNISLKKFVKTFCLITLLCVIAPFLFVAVIDLYKKATNYTPYSVSIGKSLWPFIIISWLITLTIIPVLSSIAAKYRTRTEKALTIVHYLEGLKLYIKMAEKDRLEFLQSVKNADISDQGIVKLNEKLLPYAAIFGLEKSWMKELSKYYELKNEVAPDWYTAGLNYSAIKTITSAATTRPVDYS